MKLRNVAIIAHVDHGKTTLVDRLLQQSGAFRENQRVAERAMDSNDLERERGITILAKVTSVVWNDVRINIVDTPGHADFGGEVERILNMVDGAIVLVDAAEGPLPQTKFVVSKALKVGLRPIVAINKVDRGDARPLVVAGEVFDLFAALDATEEQLDFPVLYGSAKEGWMAANLEGPKDSMAPLFDLVLSHVAPPQVEDGPFRMLGTILESNPYLGRLVTGRAAAHRHLVEGGDPRLGEILGGAVLYHCGPVVARDPSGGWRFVAAGPAGQGPQACRQLFEGEWLDQVVVGPRIEPTDPIRRRVACREHEQRRRLPVTTRPRHDVDPLGAGHPPVDHGDVVVVELQLVDRIVAALDGIDVVAVVLEPEDEDFAQAGIVLGDEHAEAGAVHGVPVATRRTTRRTLPPLRGL